MTAPSDVVVRGARNESVGPTGAETVPAGPDVRVIDGGGRVLMPGLVDAHWHPMFLGFWRATMMSQSTAAVSTPCPGPGQ